MILMYGITVVLYSMLNIIQTVLDFFCVCVYIYTHSLMVNKIWSYGTVYRSKVLVLQFFIQFCENISINIKNVLCDVTQMHSIICMKFCLISDCTHLCSEVCLDGSDFCARSQYPTYDRYKNISHIVTHVFMVNGFQFHVLK